MEKELRIKIREQISKLLENYEDDSEYSSFFDITDVPEMKGAALDTFKQDLGKENGSFTEPNDEEFEELVQGMLQANLDLYSDQELVNKAENMLHRQLNPEEIDVIKDLKSGMEKMSGPASYNE